MARSAGDTVYVKPTNNIYTVLVIVGTVVSLATLVFMYFRYEAIFGESLF